MAVKLSALRAGRLVLISVRGWVDPRAIVRLGGLGKLKKKIHLIGTRSRDLPACSIVRLPAVLEGIVSQLRRLVCRLHGRASSRMSNFVILEGLVVLRKLLSRSCRYRSTLCNFVAVFKLLSEWCVWPIHTAMHSGSITFNFLMGWITQGTHFWDVTAT
jgi:hypothetical protein